MINNYQSEGKERCPRPAVLYGLDSGTDEKTGGRAEAAEEAAVFFG